jgi:hypothetical protein
MSPDNLAELNGVNRDFRATFAAMEHGSGAVL